jgi:hypothetical protein
VCALLLQQKSQESIKMETIQHHGRVLKRMLSMQRKRVYAFDEGRPVDKQLLGIKGATLCELTQLGLPVPPGFVITTENFLEYINMGDGVTAELESQYRDAIASLEHQTQRKFAARNGDKRNLPLLLSVRAGAAVVIPGYVCDQVTHVLFYILYSCLQHA